MITATKQMKFLEILQQGVVPATGCTEPIAVAFGAATCMAHLKQKRIDQIKVSVSPNIMKNAMAVVVPGTGEPGLLIAAAAGALGGDATAGLGVIGGLDPKLVPQIKALAASGRVTAEVAAVDDDLYVSVEISNAQEQVKTYIAGEHTNIFLIKHNDAVSFAKDRPAAHATSEVTKYLQGVTFQDVWNFAQTVPVAEIQFMQTAIDHNMALAQEGLTHSYGLGLGRSMQTAKDVAFGGDIEQDLCHQMVAYTAAASDARMGGAPLPAMTNSGSGNQGITATCPVCVAATHTKATSEATLRAVTLAHLTALYIHAFLPVLSAFCATDSAAMGAATGVVQLFDGQYDTACRAINNMVSDATGMVCDGAGCSCAMKVSSSVSSMYRSVNLALQGVAVPASNGLVHADVDQTIRGIGRLAAQGMRQTDTTILDIMMEK